nr:MAG TPA: hypothetical protein [Caudoviricetes sp.]
MIPGWSVVERISYGMDFIIFFSISKCFANSCLYLS